MTAAEKIQVATMVIGFLTVIGAGGWKAVVFAVKALREESAATREAQSERDKANREDQEKRDALNHETQTELMAINAKHADSNAAIATAVQDALGSIKEMHEDYKRDIQRKAG